MNQGTLSKPARVREELFPHGLFFIGIFLGLIPRLNYLLTPIHEIGHVLAAFLTGGYGAFRWDHALTYGGNDIVILYAGVIFHVAVTTATTVALLKHNKWLFFAGFTAGAAVDQTIVAPQLTDWAAYRSELPFMDRIPPMIGVLVIAVVAIAYILNLVRLLTRLSKTG